MNQANRYYEHSGSMNMTGPIYMLISGICGSLVLGLIYGFAIFYIPFIYLNFFITLGFGLFVGFIVGLGGKLGKVRNSTVLLLFGFLFGIFAEYTGWVSWIYASSSQEIFTLDPLKILQILQILSNDGAWGIFGWTPTGIALYCIWGIEAIMIIGASTMGALAILASTPFCERCDKWIEEEDEILLEPITDAEELKSQLEQNDYNFLKSLKKTEGETEDYTQINLLHCPTCNENYYLTLISVEVTLDSDNKETKEENNILENLIITAEQYRMLKEQW
jgi:hypothetical protein